MTAAIDPGLLQWLATSLVFAFGFGLGWSLRGSREELDALDERTRRLRAERLAQQAERLAKGRAA